MSILIKAGSGLVAGVVAGALGLAFFPRVEPSALTPRAAVEKPHFVVAEATTQPTLVQSTSAVAVFKPEPDPAPEPLPSKPAPAPVLAKLDPPKPAAASPAPVPPPPKTAPSPEAAPVETRAIAPQSPAPTPAAANDEAARWSVRGLVALAKGDLSSARLFLARAAEAGDPRAWVALADTYDPAMLVKLGVVVAPGDAQRAKDYLVKAAAAGVVVKDRMAALDQAPQNLH